MAIELQEFGADQQKQILLDSSISNSRAAGSYYQGNNRYVVDLLLYDFSVPVKIPQGAKVAVECKRNTRNAPVMRIDETVTNYATIVKPEEGTNKIVLNKWGAMVAEAGQMIISVTVNDMATYTAVYEVVENPMLSGEKHYHKDDGVPINSFAKTDLSNVTNKIFADKAKNRVQKIILIFG